MTIHVRVECEDAEDELHEFDTFVQACDFIRDIFGPTAENCVIVIDTRQVINCTDCEVSHPEGECSK